MLKDATSLKAQSQQPFRVANVAYTGPRVLQTCGKQHLHHFRRRMGWPWGPNSASAPVPISGACAGQIYPTHRVGEGGPRAGFERQREVFQGTGRAEGGWGSGRDSLETGWRQDPAGVPDPIHHPNQLAWAVWSCTFQVALWGLLGLIQD